MGSADAQPLAGILSDAVLVFIGDVGFPVMNCVADVGFVF